jgi:hypothetical protein
MATTKDLGITYSSTMGNRPIGFCDADYGADESRKSILSYIFMLAGGPISWKVGMAKAISLSSAESELRSIDAAFPAIKEAIAIIKLFEELGINIVGAEPVRGFPLIINEDNKACIAYNCNLIRHSTIKHLERELYWIQEVVARGEIELIATPTKLQWTNIGTKPLGPKVLHYIRSNIMH